MCRVQSQRDRRYDTVSHTECNPQGAGRAAPCYQFAADSHLSGLVLSGWIQISPHSQCQDVINSQNWFVQLLWQLRSAQRGTWCSQPWIHGQSEREQWQREGKHTGTRVCIHNIWVYVTRYNAVRTAVWWRNVTSTCSTSFKSYLEIIVLYLIISDLEWSVLILIKCYFIPLQFRGTSDRLHSTTVIQHSATFYIKNKHKAHQIWCNTLGNYYPLCIWFVTQIGSTDQLGWTILMCIC